MSEKKREAETKEIEKRNPQGELSALDGVEAEAAVNEALAKFGAACEAVKAKRRRVYERYRELDDKMKGPGLERITVPESNPFDLDALKRAAMETGRPQEAKEWIAAVRAIASSAYRDTEFLGDCMDVLSRCGEYLSRKDYQLEKALDDLEEERKQVIAEYDRKVAKARGELTTHRDRVHREIVAKATEADMSFIENIPSCFAGDKAARTIGLVYGPDVPVKDQLNAFLNTARLRSSLSSAGDPYKHLKNLPGGYVPGEHGNMAVAVVTESGAVSSEGKTSFFDRFRRKK